MGKMLGFGFDKPEEIDRGSRKRDMVTTMRLECARMRRGRCEEMGVYSGGRVGQCETNRDACGEIGQGCAVAHPPISPATRSPEQNHGFSTRSGVVGKR